MGADGGLCWIKVLDRSAYKELTSWFSYSYLNSTAYAIKHSESCSDLLFENPPGDWEEGAYGTDTEYDLDWLCEFVEWCKSTEFHQYDYVRDWKLQHLIDSFLTEPCGIENINTNRYASLYGWNENYWDALGAFGECLVLHCTPRNDSYKFDGPPNKEMTLREWGEKMSHAIDTESYMSEQTWT